MDDGFDPYYEWLGIPARDQPPNWYRLLGIERFEANANVIERAADRQMGHLRTFQSGVHAKDSQRLLNEVSAARIGLLSPERKAAYDEKIRAEFDATFPDFDLSPADLSPADIPPADLPPSDLPTPPPVAGFDPLPPPPAIAASAHTNRSAPTVASSPIPAPLRTRRLVRRRKSVWEQPAMWGLIVLLLILVALVGYASMLIWDVQPPSWLPFPPAKRAIQSL